jgi:hypothetical protein
MSKFYKYYEQAKNLAGLFLVVYPVVQAILRTKGIVLPDFGDFTATGQISGAALLAQSDKIVKKK